MVFTGLSIGIVLSVSRGEQDRAWSEQAGEEKENVKEKEPKNVATAKAAA
jgi:hypothetical protein